MFDFLKKAIRARQLEQKPPAMPVGPALPMGMRLGASVTVDRLPFKMLGSPRFAASAGAMAEARQRTRPAAGNRLRPSLGALLG